MTEPDDILDDRYRITDRIGSGGMGDVYRARRIRLGDEVAIKFIRADIGDDPEWRDRFMTEGHACAALRHPNIVSVLDFGLTSRRGPFLVMEYLNGPSVAQEIAASGAFELSPACAILADLASALDLAHSIGLIHRDLKPANILSHRYGNGEVVHKIIDFGIALLLRNPPTATTLRGAPAFGSLPYASPEQLLGEPVDFRTDLYSLGALAFEMLTGQVPFAEKDVNALLTRVLYADPPKPSTLRPLDRHIDDAVLRALEKNPDRRWPSATAFARALGGTQPGLAERVDVRTRSGLLERYELGERIGTGRLGSEIYAGRHRAIGGDVVIRILRRSAGTVWETGRTRFLREARAMQVAHPSLLQVRDFGEEPDLVYIVTDRVAGLSLRQVIDTAGRLPWPRARRFTLDLLGAGRALHRRGGLIFGITPAIVRVPSDEAEERLVVSSAGIAEVQDVLFAAGEDGARPMSLPDNELRYVAPEVLLGEKPDGRTDIYSVGVIAYEMLTGRPPFTAGTVPQLIAQIFSAAFTAVRELAPDVPDEGAQVIARCLSQRPDRRFADLAELEAAWLATPAAADDQAV